MATSPLISIVIPAKDEEEFLPSFLESLFGQTFRGFEIIVVDDGSTDGTPEILSDAKRRSPVPFTVLRHEKSWGLTRSRNHGVREAKGAFVCMFDADNDVNADFFSACAAHLDDARVLGVEPAFDWSRDTWVERSLASILGRRELDGNRMPFVWRKTSLEELGLWDESLAFGGDKDLQRKAAAYLKEKNMRVVKEYGAVVTIHLPHTVGELFRQQQYYGRGTFLFLRGDNLIGSNVLPLAKLGYPLIVLGPFALLFGGWLGILLFAASVPYLLFEAKRMLRGLSGGEIYALATPLLDGVKFLGLLSGILDYVFSGKRYRS